MSRLQLMRWSIVLLLTVGGFGACLGAVISAKKQANDPLQRSQESNQYLTRIQPAIDQSRTTTLDVKKVPADFSKQAFLHVRALVDFAPPYYGQPGLS